MVAGELLTLQQVMRKLNVGRHKINYLFESRKLKDEDYPQIGGRRFYRHSDLDKIKEALFSVQNR